MHDFKELKDFGRYLTFKSKRKLTVFAILLSVIPTTLLAYFPLEFRYLYIFGLMASAIAPLHSIVNLITGSTLQIIRAFLYNRKHTPKKIHFPEVKTIAQKIGLDYDRAICVTENPAIKSAYVNLSTKNITIPS